MLSTRLNTLSQRRLRLAQAATVGGSLALGSLLVQRLVTSLHDGFLDYYGLDGGAASAADPFAQSSQLPITVGQLLITALGLLVVVAFVVSERRRLRINQELGDVCRGRGRSIIVERLSASVMVDEMVLRTARFGGLLFSIWLLQSSLEQRLAGNGWGLELADWQSVLPLVSVFGVSVLAAVLVAAISLVGFRAIHVLELVIRQIVLARRRIVSSPAPVVRIDDVSKMLRQLLGRDILSRPPPVAC